MVNYQCQRCGYTSIDKSKISSHLGRKYTCNPDLYDINLDEYKEYILKGILYKNLKVNKIKSIATPQNPNKSITNSKDLDTSINFECKFCENNYSSKSNLNKHLKICKDKKEDDEVKKSMNELVVILNEQLIDYKKELEKRDKELEKRDKELEKRDKQLDELIKKAGINNSTITQNIQNNIKLLAYKDTDVSNLTDKDILKCMNHSNMCVPHLIKMIHFDPEKPENHNVYISNLKNGYIMAYDGDKWDTKNRDEIITDMIDDKQGLIEERIEIWIEKGKKYPSIMKKFERYLEIKENNIVINKIKEEIKLMLFNNKNLIKERLN